MTYDNQNANPYQPPTGARHGPRSNRWLYLLALLIWAPISIGLGFLVSIRIYAWLQFTGIVENVPFDSRKLFLSGIFFAFVLYVTGRIVLRGLAKCGSVGHTD